MEQEKILMGQRQLERWHVMKMVEVGINKKGFSAEQVIGKLIEAEVLLGQGSTVGEMSRNLWVTEQTYYRWRRQPNLTCCAINN